MCSSFGSLSPPNYTWPGKHHNGYLAYLCGILPVGELLLGGFFLLALLSPTCLSRFAGYFFSSFGREFFGAGFAALASPELAQESGRLAPLFLGHAVILAWAGRHDKEQS